MRSEADPSFYIINPKDYAELNDRDKELLHNNIGNFGWKNLYYCQRIPKSESVRDIEFWETCDMLKYLKSTASLHHTILKCLSPQVLVELNEEI